MPALQNTKDDFSRSGSAAMLDYQLGRDTRRAHDTTYEPVLWAAPRLKRRGWRAFTLPPADKSRALALMHTSIYAFGQPPAHGMHAKRQPARKEAACLIFATTATRDSAPCLRFTAAARRGEAQARARLRSFHCRCRLFGILSTRVASISRRTMPVSLSYSRARSPASGRHAISPYTRILGRRLYAGLPRRNFCYA